MGQWAGCLVGSASGLSGFSWGFFGSLLEVAWGVLEASWGSLGRLWPALWRRVRFGVDFEVPFGVPNSLTLNLILTFYLNIVSYSFFGIILGPLGVVWGPISVPYWFRCWAPQARGSISEYRAPAVVCVGLWVFVCVYVFVSICVS